MERPPLPRDDKPLFYARIPVNRHHVKKNGREVMYNKRTGKPFVGKSTDLQRAEQLICLYLLRARQEFQVFQPYVGDVHLCARFIFSDFYRKDGVRRRNLPDLSNLVQLPEDCLQSARIIENDSQIVSLDGSRRLPGVTDLLELWLWPG